MTLLEFIFKLLEHSWSRFIESVDGTLFVFLRQSVEEVYFIFNVIFIVALRTDLHDAPEIAQAEVILDHFIQLIAV